MSATDLSSADWFRDIEIWLTPKQPMSTHTQS
jgi:hypothetical protein